MHPSLGAEWLGWAPRLGTSALWPTGSVLTGVWDHAISYMQCSQLTDSVWWKSESMWWMHMKLTFKLGIIGRLNMLAWTIHKEYSYLGYEGNSMMTGPKLKDLDLCHKNCVGRSDKMTSIWIDCHPMVSLLLLSWHNDKSSLHTGWLVLWVVE